MEIELKLALPDDATGQRILHDPRVAAAAACAPGTYHMHSLYYDTADRRMRAACASLRLRYEGRTPEPEQDRGHGGYVCCLKVKAGETVGGLWVRQEYETPAQDILTGIESLLEKGAPRALLPVGEALSVVGEVRFVRQSMLLELGGSLGELCIDSGVFNRPEGGGVPFFELELELKRGDIAPLQAFAALLSSDYGLSPQPRSKFSRAAELYADRTEAEAPIL